MAERIARQEMPGQAQSVAPGRWRRAAADHRSGTPATAAAAPPTSPAPSPRHRAAGFRRDMRQALGPAGDRAGGQIEPVAEVGQHGEFPLDDLGQQSRRPAAARGIRRSRPAKIRGQRFAFGQARPRRPHRPRSAWPAASPPPSHAAAPAWIISPVKLPSWSDSRAVHCTWTILPGCQVPALPREAPPRARPRCKPCASVITVATRVALAIGADVEDDRGGVPFHAADFTADAAGTPFALRVKVRC